MDKKRGVVLVGFVQKGGRDVELLNREVECGSEAHDRTDGG